MMMCWSATESRRDDFRNSRRNRRFAFRARRNIDHFEKMMVQLTSDKRRSDAHRFYGRLGFTASHEGFKLQLGEG